MLSTDKAWEKFGRDEPYFGVLADEKFTTAKIRDNRDEFFGSGKSSVSKILGGYEERFGELHRDRALDHGCGWGSTAWSRSSNMSHAASANSSSDEYRAKPARVDD